MKKIRVGVLTGGASAERDISLATGAQIKRSLPADRYDVVLLDPLAFMVRNPALTDAQRAQAEALLKGATEGGAMVSTKHANFIVNIGDASAEDVRTLMARCQAEVKRKFGVDLVPEVELVGEW